jgi:hypothetical protein
MPLIRVATILAINNPLIDPPWWEWSSQVSSAQFYDEIAEAIDSGRLLREPVNPAACNRPKLAQMRLHAQRIAWFVTNKWTDDIEVDVGVPSANYNPNWLVVDGNHRLAAAAYRKDEFIRVKVGGQVSQAVRLFNLPAYVLFPEGDRV